MNMRMRNGLACSKSIVYADIEPIWIEFDHYFLSQLNDKLPDFLLVLFGEIKNAACVSERYNQ